MGTLKKWHAVCVLGCALMVSVNQVEAQSSAPQNPVEQHLVASGSKITTRFMSASGLTAIVADSGKEQRMFYETPDGKALILGAVFDAQGRNLSEQDMQTAMGIQAQVAAPSTSAASEGRAVPANGKDLLTRAKSLPWIADGSKGKVVYAIFDPNCPVCHRLHGVLRPMVASGQVQVRWIPVSILAESGSGMIAAIYGAKDHAAALQSAFDHVLAPQPVSRPVNVAIARNVLLLRDVGYAGVPVLLYDDQGKAAIQQGLPSLEKLKAIIGS